MTDILADSRGWIVAWMTAVIGEGTIGPLILRIRKQFTSACRLPTVDVAPAALPGDCARYIGYTASTAWFVFWLFRLSGAILALMKGVISDIQHAVRLLSR